MRASHLGLQERAQRTDHGAACPSQHKHKHGLKNKNAAPLHTSGSTIVCGSRAHAVLMRCWNILGVTRPASSDSLALCVLFSVLFFI